MKRRAFIAGLGGAAIWPLTARAQQLPVIGFLHGGAPEPNDERLAAFLKGLRETGFVEGQNVALEFRWAEGRYDRLPAMAADLVRRQVTAIATLSSTPAALAAKAAAVDAELQKLRTLYTQLWRAKTGSVRDPFNELDRGADVGFGLESLSGAAK